MKQTIPTPSNSSDTTWQAIAEASLLEDLKTALHGKLSPADQQMMLREFNAPEASLRQKILINQILAVIQTIPQWSNAESLQNTYQNYGYKLLFFQSFESSASYAVLALRPDGQYQAEFNIDPSLEVSQQITVRKVCTASFQEWIAPLSIEALISTEYLPPLPLNGYSVLPTKEQALRQLAWMLVEANQSDFKEVI